jgi:hypothetical protein
MSRSGHASSRRRTGTEVRRGSATPAVNTRGWLEHRAVHFAIYPAEAAGRAGERRSGGSVFPGFYVESLDRAAEALAEVSAPILTSHEEMPWGCRIVAEDPDGRVIEVNQREHCQHAG